MADDRYDWLDGEAAERLLCGVPLNAPSAAADTPDGADERLAAALDALAAEYAPAFPPGTCSQRCELPGEAEALRAFQAAHAPLLEGAAVGAEKVSSAASVGGREVASDGRVRLLGRRGPGCDSTGGSLARGSRGSRSILFGKPLRAGFAMAVAGCALGGVAVAASEGVLPTPFGGGGTPAVSVSPVISPDEQGAKGGSGEGGGSADTDEDASDDDVDAGHRSDSPQDDLAGSGDRKGTDEGVTASRGSESPSGSGGEKGEREEGEDGKPQRPDPDKTEVAVALCHSYEQDELDPEKRKKLERAAGGPEAVEKFCEEHGEGDQGGGSGGSGGGDSGSGGGGGPGRPGHSAGGGGDAPSTGGGESGEGNGGPNAPSSGGRGDVGASQTAGSPHGAGRAAGDRSAAGAGAS